MKNFFSHYLHKLILVAVIFVSSQNAYASHLFGAGLRYTYVSGMTYKVTLELYGDCGPASRTVFNTLSTATPEICVYDGSTSFSTITLGIDTPSAGIELTPLCAGDTSTCTSLTATIPGVKKFSYSGTVTLSHTSSVWRFIFVGHTSSTISAGRTASITNLMAGFSIQLIDTLNNTTYTNSSSNVTVSPSPYFPISTINHYLPLAVDPDGDTLYYELVGATNGNNICGSIGGPVTYIGLAWPGTPASGAHPLSVASASDFSFNSGTGEIIFKPNILQRSTVVYNIRETRGGTFVGNSQMEFNFNVLMGSGTGPCFGWFFSGTPIFSAGCGGSDTLSIPSTSGCSTVYQWQRSTDSVTWTNISGATDTSYIFSSSTAYYYRVVLTCTLSGYTEVTGFTYVPATTSGPHFYSLTTTVTDTSCSHPNFFVEEVCGSSSAYSVTTYYGDGTSDVTTLPATRPYRATYSHVYSSPGTYTVKQVLFDGTTRIDSATTSYYYAYCRMFPLTLFIDSNSDCIMESYEHYNMRPALIKVDSNGVTIDTISVTSGTYYRVTGLAGTIYKFTVLTAPVGFSIHCPSTGIIYDTILSGVSVYPTNYFGFNCITGTAFDLTEYSSAIRPCITRQRANVFALNNYCYPENGTVTLNFSPKYSYSVAYPAPASTTATSITWNLPGLSSAMPFPENLYYDLTYNTSTGMLTPGDTVHTSINIDPLTGDINPYNNSETRVDTVRSSYDPNTMTVNPEGYIVAGTKLTYTISFENTGNDTAHNIHIIDTLSDYVDISSLRLLASSAKMNIITWTAGGHNIVKFDFPNINLLDSSHHGQCEGTVKFSINTYFGLAPFTRIYNHAAIFFDVNPGVLTNTVLDIINRKEGIDNLGNAAQAVILYPNPADDILTIAAGMTHYNSYTLTNALGQVLQQQDIINNLTTVNIKSLPAGLYYVQVRGNDGVNTQKFIKK